MSVINEKANFDAEIAKHSLVVVDFYATWCGPCKMIGPVVEKEVNEGSWKEKVFLIKVDVDEAEELAKEYEIRAMPTFIVFKDGKKVDSLEGANIEKLKALVNPHL